MDAQKVRRRTTHVLRFHPMKNLLSECVSTPTFCAMPPTGLPITPSSYGAFLPPTMLAELEAIARLDPPLLAVLRAEIDDLYQDLVHLNGRVERTD